MINIGVGISEEMHKKLTTDGKHLTTDAKSSQGLWTNELIIASPACPMIICITRKLRDLSNQVYLPKIFVLGIL